MRDGLIVMGAIAAAFQALRALDAHDKRRWRRQLAQRQAELHALPHQPTGFRIVGRARREGAR